MYATRTNTKYTEFIRGYYQDPLKNVTTPPQSPDNNIGFNHFNSYSFPLKQHSIVEIGDGANNNLTHHDPNRDDSENVELVGNDNLDIDLHHHSSHKLGLTQFNHSNFSFDLTPSLIGGKTKYEEIFDSTQSPALRLKLLRETEKFGGKTKVFSDSDLVLLHQKVQQSYQLLSPRNLSAAPASKSRHSRQSSSKIKTKKIVAADDAGQVAAVLDPDADPNVKIDTGAVVESQEKLDIDLDLESVILHPIDDNNIDEVVSKHFLQHHGEDGVNRGISDLENDLQRLNDETLRVLSKTRSRSTSTPKLEDFSPLISAAAAATTIGHTGPGSGFINHVSYQEILKAEHVALRRELLSNIREISRATFYEDFYTGRMRSPRQGDSSPVASAPADGQEKLEGKTEAPEAGGDDGGKRNSGQRMDSAFHLNLQPGTADPAERVSLWLNSQENLNHVSQDNQDQNPVPVPDDVPDVAKEQETEIKNDHQEEKKSANLDKKSASILPDNDSPPLHASLFHDSIWAEEEAELESPPVQDELLIDNVNENVEHEQSKNIDSASDKHAVASSSVRIPSESLLETKPLVINNIVIHNYDNENSKMETAQVHEAPQENFVVATDSFDIFSSDPPLPPASPTPPSSSLPPPNHDDPQQEQTQEQFVVDDHNSIIEENNDDSDALVAEAQVEVDAEADPAVVESAELENENVDNPQIDHVEEEDVDVDVNIDTAGSDKMPHYSIPHADTVVEDELVEEDEVKEGNEQQQDEDEHEDKDEHHPDDEHDEQQNHSDNLDNESKNSFPKSTKTARSNSASELDNSDHLHKVMIPVVARRTFDLDSRRSFTKYTDYYRTNDNIVATHDTNNDDNIASPADHSLELSGTSTRDVVKVLPIPATVVVIPQATREHFPDRIYQPKVNYKNLVDRAKETNEVNPFTVAPIPITVNMLNSSSSNSNSNSNNDTGSSSNTIKTFSKVNDPPRKLNVIQVDGQNQPPGYIKNPKGRGKVPGILRRHNMDQWVAKKLYFFINGDEHFPKFEYRFRPKKDVKNLDTLCDILSKKLNLDRGVRYIFSIDGHHIERLEDLRHDHSYVVSSTKKFKVIHRFQFEGRPNFKSNFKPKKMSSVPNLNSIL